MGAPLLARDLRNSWLREQVASNFYETVKDVCVNHGVILPSWDDLIDKNIYYQKADKIFDNLKFSLFWGKIEKTETCWIWRGRVDKRCGYGKFDVNGVDSYTHRVMWEIIHGPIPDGLFVCHDCDNPPCVRPDHLFLGTPLDNSMDRNRKGRTHGPVGELNGQTKLTDEQVREIRVALRDGEGRSKLAEEYNVSTSTIYYIKVGRRWKHVQLQSI